MLSKLRVSSISNLVRRGFASEKHVDHKPQLENQGYDPKWNQFINKPPTKPDPFSLTELMRCQWYAGYRKEVIRFLARLPSSSHAQLSSDYFCPPRLTENSVFVYQSIKLASWARFVRSTDYILLGSLLFAGTYPVWILTAAAIHYGLWARNSAYKLFKYLVIRMDVLPNTESIAFQKVRAFGRVQTIVVPIKNLEYVEEAEPNNMPFWNSVKPALDRQLVFRNTETGELFMFDKNGLWSKQGLEHPLIY